MKKYRFLFVPNGGVPRGEVNSVIQAGYDEVPQIFCAKIQGCQLECTRVVFGTILPPQQRDRFVELFMVAEPFQSALRLFDMYVKYGDVSLPYGGIRVVQDPSEIYSSRYNEKKCDFPIYITCHPEERSVTLSAQIIEPDSLADCRRIFLAFQRQVEELLITSARAKGQLQEMLQSRCPT